jgi:hypothetical protein
MEREEAVLRLTKEFARTAVIQIIEGEFFPIIYTDKI